MIIRKKAIISFFVLLVISAFLYVISIKAVDIFLGNKDNLNVKNHHAFNRRSNNFQSLYY